MRFWERSTHHGVEEGKLEILQVRQRIVYVFLERQRSSVSARMDQRLIANQALHADAPALRAGVPSLALGAGERGR